MYVICSLSLLFHFCDEIHHSSHIKCKAFLVFLLCIINYQGYYIIFSSILFFIFLKTYLIFINLCQKSPKSSFYSQRDLKSRILLYVIISFSLLNNSSCVKICLFFAKDLLWNPSCKSFDFLSFYQENHDFLPLYLWILIENNFELVFFIINNINFLFYSLNEFLIIWHRA